MVQKQASALRQISTPAEAASVVGHLNDVMDALLNVVEQETVLVREGRLKEFAGLESAKATLTQQYIADVSRLRASTAYLDAHEPALVAALRQRHAGFHARLQVNLTVLATAHAVAEGIIRGVSAEISNKTAPQVYGATGRKVVARPYQAAPLAMARSL
jgi:hypothetical protein